MMIDLTEAEKKAQTLAAALPPLFDESWEKNIKNNKGNLKKATKAAVLKTPLTKINCISND